MKKHKMYRCIRLMQLLQDKYRNIYTIARYLNVTERTVYRYLKLYSELGYKIIKDKNNKVKIEQV